MASITIPIDDETLARLETFASKRSMSAEALLRSYAEFLTGTDTAMDDEGDDIPTKGIMRLLEIGGSFDWLKDEPDLYEDVTLEPFG